MRTSDKLADTSGSKFIQDVAGDLRCDACIVGAGPGGTLLALLLLQAGFSVTLVERNADFEREFRGEFLQPGALRIFDGLGLLGELVARGQVMRDYQLCEGARPLFSYRFDRICGPLGAGLNVSQAVVLPTVVRAARQYPGFRFLAPAAAQAIIRDRRGRVGGITATFSDEVKRTIEATIVIGADGRNSTIRRLAKISTSKLPFQKDVLWLRVRRPSRWPESFTVRIAYGTFVALVPIYPDRLQLGFNLNKGEFNSLKAGGIDAFRTMIARIVPEIAAELHETLRGWDDISILNVQSINADHWCEDGLVLMGDAAHTMSPVAGLGITQALKDAVLLRELLVTPLRSGVVCRDDLVAFESRRRRETMRLAKLQQAQERLMLMPGWTGTMLRSVVYPAIMRTGLMRRMGEQMTLGDIDGELRRLQATSVA